MKFYIRVYSDTHKEQPHRRSDFQASNWTDAEILAPSYAHRLNLPEGYYWVVSETSDED